MYTAPDFRNPIKSLDPFRLLLVQMDAADPSSITPAIEAAISKFSKVDLLVNSTGYGQNDIFEMISPEQARRPFDVNAFGVMNVIRDLLPHLRIAGGGIINISSSAGVFTLPMLPIYCASKFTLEGFTETLSYELASQNIFTPSYADYAMKFMKVYEKMSAPRKISSDEVADVISAAATDGADKLRYFVGHDTRGFIKAQCESASDNEYVQRMRSFFA
ncbi:short-chain alcohol dehydrogenase [Desarmillaria ectypa]|nr:short-chain alcohol dehydrogenase [Desarmillaria ectypa]